MQCPILAGRVIVLREVPVIAVFSSGGRWIPLELGARRVLGVYRAI